MNVDNSKFKKDLELYIIYNKNHLNLFEKKRERNLIKEKFCSPCVQVVTFYI